MEIQHRRNGNPAKQIQYKDSYLLPYSCVIWVSLCLADNATDHEFVHVNDK